MARPLTKKQEDFCLNIFEGKTGIQSAIEAGYAFKAAVVTASENLRKANIIARIAELRQRVEDESVATVLERKQVLTEILRGRLAHFMGKDLSLEMSDNAALQEVVVSVFGGKDGDDITTTRIKLNDPVKAIQELNKMERVYGEMGIVIDNRTISITVASEEGKDMTKRIMAGEGTGKETDD